MKKLNNFRIPGGAYSFRSNKFLAHCICAPFNSTNSDNTFQVNSDAKFKILSRITEFAKALAHPARLIILKVLAAKQECICGDLVLDLPIAQSTVSQLLKALKESGLIKGRVDGPRSSYCVDWKNFIKFKKLMTEFSDKVAHLKLNQNAENSPSLSSLFLRSEGVKTEC